MDQRIYVIHQKNKGVSVARNAGLERSSGDYIMFVDGDDWVDPDYVSYFLGLVKETGTLIGMNKNNYSAQGLKQPRKNIQLKQKKQSSGYTRMRFLWLYGIKFIAVGCWWIIIFLLIQVSGMAKECYSIFNAYSMSIKSQ